jgi:VanZ family protein
MVTAVSGPGAPAVNWVRVKDGIGMNPALQSLPLKRNSGEATVNFVPPLHWVYMPWIRLLPALAWAGVIFVLSSMPNPPGAPGVEWASLAAHVFVYAVLAVLLAWFVDSAFPRRGWRARMLPYLAVWLVAVLYGISDEIHQAFVPNRNPSAIDVIADGIGAALGLSLWAASRPLRRRLPGQRPRRTSPDAPAEESLAGRGHGA